jgi:biopolymer transport protein ExbD
MRIQRRETPTIDMQIAPMVDIGFLLLIFFMVTARPMKPEADVGMTLPGTVAQEESVDIPDEQRIAIQPNGQVVVNDLPVDTPGPDPQLPQLVRLLTRFKQACDANKTQALVTVAPEDTVPHQRIIDVMNACAAADVHGVTLSTASDEEGAL